MAEQDPNHPYWTTGPDLDEVTNYYNSEAAKAREGRPTPLFPTGVSGTEREGESRKKEEGRSVKYPPGQGPSSNQTPAPTPTPTPEATPAVPGSVTPTPAPTARPIQGPPTPSPKPVVKPVPKPAGKPIQGPPTPKPTAKPVTPVPTAKPQSATAIRTRMRAIVDKQKTGQQLSDAEVAEFRRLKEELKTAK